MKSIVETYRDRVTTIGDYMINSHGPSLKDKQMAHKHEDNKSKKMEGDHEVVVLPFKKIKKLKEGNVSHIDISKR